MIRARGHSRAKQLLVGGECSFRQCLTIPLTIITGILLLSLVTCTLDQAAIPWYTWSIRKQQVFNDPQATSNPLSTSVSNLASSVFLVYYQSLNEINHFTPLVLGHVLAAGDLAEGSVTLLLPYAAARAGIAVAVVRMRALRIVYSPAISTSLVFSSRPHEVSALATILMTRVVVILAARYATLRHGISPSRLAHRFGPIEEVEPPAAQARRTPQPSGNRADYGSR